jgi:lysophospholipase L1-like esterase
MKPSLLILVLLSLLSSCAKDMTVLNKGIAGNNTQDLVKRIDRDVLAEHPDLVILMAGSNDMLNSRKFISYAAFCDNYQQLIGALKSRGIGVVLMSPPPVDTGYVFQRHDRRLFVQEPNARLDSLNRLIRQLATLNQVHYIDINGAFTNLGSPNRQPHSLIINQANMGIADGLHPTREGYQLIAGEVYRYLKQHKLLKRKQKILCFGDSITYGAFMAGKGTTLGDTYPAYLQRLLLPGR